MKPLRQFLEPLLSGRPLESGPEGALAVVIWVLRMRLEEIERTVWGKHDSAAYESLFQRRIQLLEDIAAVEAMHRRALGQRPFGREGIQTPEPGPGYGER